MRWDVRRTIWHIPHSSAGPPTLVIYRSGARADEELRRLCMATRERGSRVTVLALAAQERPSSRCCDTRSVLWNEVRRVLAGEDLARAARALDGQAEVDLDVVVAPGRQVVRALIREVVARGADEIVLVDQPRSGLGRLERRRLRRRSRIPVSG